MQFDSAVVLVWAIYKGLHLSRQEGATRHILHQPALLENLIVPVQEQWLVGVKYWQVQALQVDTEMTNDLLNVIHQLSFLSLTESCIFP